MILDELIAKIGFQVDDSGAKKAIGAVKDLQTGLASAVKGSLGDGAKSSNAFLRGFTQGINDAVKEAVSDLKLLERQRKATSKAGEKAVREELRAVDREQKAVARAAKARRVAEERETGKAQREAGARQGGRSGGGGSFFGALSGITGAIETVKAVVGLLKEGLGVSAAQARAKLGGFARTNNTTTGRLDRYLAGTGLAGLDEEKQKTALGEIAKAVEDSVTGGKGGRVDWLKNYGIDTMSQLPGERGKRRNTADVLDDFNRKYLKDNDAIEALRRQRDEATARGDKGAVKTITAALNPLEKAQARVREKSGLGAEYFGDLIGTNAAEYAKKQEEARQRVKGYTEQQEEEAKGLNKAWNELTLTAKELATAFSQEMTPMATRFVQGLSSMLKDIETSSLKNFLATTAMEFETLSGALKKFVDYIASWIPGFKKPAEAAKQEAQNSTESNSPGRATTPEISGRVRPRDNSHLPGQGASPGISGRIRVNENAPRRRPSFFGLNGPRPQTQQSNPALSAFFEPTMRGYGMFHGTTAKAQQKIQQNVDNSVKIGNITAPVTINQNVPAAAAAASKGVEAAVNRAGSQAKASGTPTVAATAP